jgi:hypothetical protein
MVTATRSETRTANRKYLLQWQVRNLVSRTTAESQQTLAKFDKGVTNQWLGEVGVYGLDQSLRAVVGLELAINWLNYSIQVLIWGETVSVNQTLWAEDCAPEVSNAIEVFNQAVKAEDLKPEWRCWYAPGVDEEMVNRELGFKNAPPLPWAGKVEQQASQVKELPELTVTFLQAIAEETLPETSRKSEPEKSLFERIKEVLEGR